MYSHSGEEENKDLKAYFLRFDYKTKCEEYVSK